MKDSGIEWIGKIPEDWNISKYKYEGDILSGFPFESSLFTNDESKMPLMIIPLRRRRQSGILSSSCPTRTAVP